MVDYSFTWNYDSAKSIPGTYSEAWEQTISEAWESIVEQSETVPGEKDKPAEGEDEDKDDPEGGGGGDDDNKQIENPDNFKRLDKMSPEEISKLTSEQFKESLPKGWTYEEHNGFIHIKDVNNTIRIRIDPPDNVTNYTHMHIYDEFENPLDINGNIVDPSSPDAHIPWYN